MTLHKDYDRNGSVAKQILIVSLEGLGAKTNWLEVTSDFDSVRVESESRVYSESSVESWDGS
jgi:hypothetical protein